MYRSQQFYNQLKKSTPETRKEELFRKAVSHVPTALASELFEAISREITVGNRPDTLYGDVIDLLHQDYDERDDPLTPGDWDLLRDLINDYALELELSLVQYVMERVVERGRIDEI